MRAAFLIYGAEKPKSLTIFGDPANIEVLLLFDLENESVIIL